MRLGKLEYQMVRAMAAVLDCEPREVAELAVRTMFDVLCDGEANNGIGGGAVARSMRAMVVEARSAGRAAAQGGAPFEARRRKREAIRARAEATQSRPVLTHNPFADLLSDTPDDGGAQ